VAPPAAAATRRRIERRHGEVPRLLLALPAPSPDDPDHAALRMVAAVLALGRSSRLQRQLVEEGELCLALSAGLAENALASSFTMAAEVLPGVEPAEIERRIVAELADLAARPVADAELDRARQVFLADWVFGQERIHQQGLAAGVALALFDLGQPDRLLRAALEAEPADLSRVAARWLDVECGVAGLSLPE
jgi:zinc protease